MRKSYAIIPILMLALSIFFSIQTTYCSTTQPPEISVGPENSLDDGILLPFSPPRNGPGSGGGQGPGNPG